MHKKKKKGLTIENTVKKRKKNKPSAMYWYQDNDVFYLCKHCKKWFLLKNFNLHEQMCKKCSKILE